MCIYIYTYIYIQFFNSQSCIFHKMLLLIDFSLCLEDITLYEIRLSEKE